jgi:hypothetical protein
MELIKNNKSMTVKDWIVMMFLLSIPIVNIVLLFVWAFGENTNATRKNFSQGFLAFNAIIIGLLVAILIGLNGKLPNINVNEPLSGKINPLSIITQKKANIDFNNVVVKNNFGLSEVNGEMINKDNNSYSFVTFTISFYNADKKLMGTAQGIMEQIGANETKTFTAMGTSEYSKATSYKAQVDSVN